MYVRKFLQRIHWKPNADGSVRWRIIIPRYKLHDRLAIQLIMRLTGGETDPTKEIEYTDWGKVTAFVDNLSTAVVDG